MKPVADFFNWWIDELARVAEPVVARYGRPSAFVLVQANGRYECWRVSKKGTELFGTAETGQLAGADWARKLKSRPLELRMDADRLLDRTLNLPGASRQYLDAILRHQIERLTPWSADRVAFDYVVADEGHSDGDQMQIRLVATARDTVTEALAPLEAAGLNVRAVGTSADPVEHLSSFDLQDSSKTERRHAIRRNIAIGLSAAAALALILGGYQSWVLYRLSSQSDDLQAAIDQRRSVIAAAVERTAASEHNQKLAARKAAALPMVLLLDELSSRIPTDTYLTEMSVEGTTVRLNGLSTQAPELISVIEMSDHLSGAQFAAPTTRTENGASDSFQIVAEVSVPDAPEAPDAAEAPEE